MEGILTSFVIVLGVIVVSSIVNEKKLHIQHDIAIVLFSFLISFGILIFNKFNLFGVDESILGYMNSASLDVFLLECTLCFMLFAGARKVHLNKIIKNMIPIISLSIVTTIVSSLCYGVIFYLINLLFKFNMNFWICMLLGVLVSPTDPIAATGILNKLRYF